VTESGYWAFLGVLPEMQIQEWPGIVEPTGRMQFHFLVYRRVLTLKSDMSTGCVTCQSFGTVITPLLRNNALHGTTVAANYKSEGVKRRKKHEIRHFTSRNQHRPPYTLTGSARLSGVMACSICCHGIHFSIVSR